MISRPTLLAAFTLIAASSIGSTIVRAAAADKIILDGHQSLSGMRNVADPEDSSNQVTEWKNASLGHRLALSRSTLDLSAYEALSFRMYSPVADQHGIVVLVDSNGETEGNYYQKKIVVNWAGWKTVVIPFEHFESTRSPVGWHKVDQIMLANSGYGGTSPNPNAEYYVDDLMALEEAPEVAGPAPDETVRLSLMNSRISYKFPIDGSKEHIYGVEFEYKGSPKSQVKIYEFKTWNADGELIHKEDVTGHGFQSPVTDGWEVDRVEFLTHQGADALGLLFVMGGDEPIELRNVKVVKGGFPDNPPLPEAPYLGWIESLEPDLSIAGQSPLLTYEEGGSDVWYYRDNQFYVTDQRMEELKARLAPYRALSVRELVDLVPKIRPFALQGYWEAPYDWSPETPDVIFHRKTKEPFDYEAEFPIHGYEEVRAPSGKLVRYAYHDTAKDDPKYKGERVYVEQFMGDARNTALMHAGYEMAALFRRTGDPEYGVRAAAILWAMARNMPDWPVTGKPFWNAPPESKGLKPADYYSWFSYVMGGDWYVTSTGNILWLARYFDMIRDFPEVWEQLAAKVSESHPREETASGLLHLGKMALKRDAYYRSNEFVFYHNLSGTENRSLIQLGRVLGIPSLVHYGLHRVEGAFRKRFMADGVFPESQWYTLDQYVRQSQALDALEDYHDPESFVCSFDGERLDVEDPTNSIPTYDRITEALERQTFPDGTALTVHDSWSQTANPPKGYSLKFPGREEVDPYLFNAYGHGILGRGTAPNRIESHLHFGGYYNHGHRDMLNLILWANGDELISDIGYTHISQYHGSTLSHNLVVVDQRVQQNRMHAGNLLTWNALKGATQVVQAEQGEMPAYPQCSLYRRSLVLLPFDDAHTAVLDIFEVEGGERHDWMANGCADYEQLMTSTLEPEQTLDNLAADGVALENPLPWGEDSDTIFTQDGPESPSIFYGAFRNARIAEPKTNWQATMRPGEPAGPGEAWAGDRAKDTGPKPSLRMHWLEPLDGKAILAEAPRNRYLDELHNKEAAKKVWAENRMPKIIVSREGEQLKSLFAAAWEPFNDQPFLEEVSKLSDLKGVGHGWSLRAGEVEKTVLYRPLENIGRLSSAKLRTDGRFAIRSETADEVQLDLYEGKMIADERLTARIAELPGFDVVGAGEVGDDFVFTVDGAIDPATAGGYLVFAQEGSSNRWLKLERVEASGTQTKLFLAEDPGFVYKPELKALREDFFPHRTIKGAARIHLPGWLNVKRSSGDNGAIHLWVRASGEVQFAVSEAEGLTAVQLRSKSGEWVEHPSTGLDGKRMIDLPTSIISDDWVELRIAESDESS